MQNFTQAAVVSYLDGTDLAAAAAALEADPELGRRDVYHAACAGDVDALEAFLDADPDLVHRPGGHFEWVPLMYACYSRMVVEGRSTRAAAELLLARGADPNSFYLWGEQYRFTALTGVFGEGEQGPANSPEHPDCLPLARSLLEAGAAPDDGQALYNRMFTPGHACLEILLEFGLGPQHPNNWLLHDAQSALVANDEQLLGYQLRFALEQRYFDRARLLIDAGAALHDQPGKLPLFVMARFAGSPEVAEHLVARGATRTILTDEEEFVAACMAGDEPLARQLLHGDEGLARRALDAMPDFVRRAGDTGNENAVRLFAALGFDLSRGGSPLPGAVWKGDLEMVRLLVELGVDPRATDRTHHATAVGWACYHGDRQEHLEFLGTLDVDAFDLLACGRHDRLALAVDVDPSLLGARRCDLREIPKDGNGLQTLLASAVLGHDVEAVRLLVERGASRDYEEGGRDLVEIAKAKKASAIVALLEKSSR